MTIQGIYNRNCMFILMMHSSPSFCLIVPTAAFLSRPQTQCTEKFAANRLLLFLRTVWWSLWSEMCQVKVTRWWWIGWEILLLCCGWQTLSLLLENAWDQHGQLLRHFFFTGWLKICPEQLMPAPSRLVHNLKDPSLLELYRWQALQMGKV